MIKYELKKMWKNKFFFTFLILFLLIDVFVVYNKNLTQINERKFENYDKCEKLYQDIKGVISSDKIIKIQNAMDNVETYGLYPENIYDEMKSAYEYKNRAKSVVMLALSNEELYAELGHEKMRYYNQYIAKVFTGRNIEEYYNYEGIHNYLSHDYATIMVFDLLIIGCMILFYKDKKIGMDKMIQTSRYGKNLLIKRKVEVLLGSCILILLGFRIVEFVQYYCIYQFDGLHMPLYCVTEYEETFYNKSIFSYFLLDCFLKILGEIFICLLLCICSLLIKFQWIAYGISGLILFAFPIPIKLFDNYEMITKYEFVSIGKYYVNELWVNAGVIFLICSVIYLGIFLKNRGSYVEV